MDEWKHVEYLGVLNRKEVFDLYNKASIGIAVHNYTANVGGKEGGLGFIKNFEFMMSGLPIICTDFNVWEKIINENNCGICVNPHDCDGIAKAINYLINNPQEAKEMGENGKKTVREKYNWQTQENSLINLYDKLSTLE